MLEAIADEVWIADGPSVSLAGPDGSTPREWRATFLDRRAARAAIRRALDWNPARMVIAHGAWARDNAAQVLRSSLSWLKP